MSAMFDGKPAPQISDMAADTMLHALMSITLDELKLGMDPWQKLSQDDQDEVIERVGTRVREAVQAVIHLISSHGFVRIAAKLDSIQVKDGMRAVLSIRGEAQARHDLVDAQGGVVTIVLADASAFVEAPHGHKADPDQTAMDLEDSAGVKVVELFERAWGTAGDVQS